MIYVVLILLTLAVAANTAIVGVFAFRLLKKDRLAESEKKAEDAMDEESRRQHDMAEGFENIMSYRVRGNDGWGAK